MKKLLILVLLSGSLIPANGQTFLVTFDTLSLSQPDTFYVNYGAPGTDVGFTDWPAYFPCVYDTSGGIEFWSSGFAYSNMTDTVTSGFENQHAAITGAGFDNSPQYVVAFGNENYITTLLPGYPITFQGFYVTNTTYAYNSMRDGDMFAKKFGGVTGDDPDCKNGIKSTFITNLNEDRLKPALGKIFGYVFIYFLVNVNFVLKGKRHQKGHQKGHQIWQR